MERNNLTTAATLQIGDRFYKAGSRSKKVCTVTKKIGFAVHAAQDPDRASKTFSAWDRVVFLRHAGEAAEKEVAV